MSTKRPARKGNPDLNTVRLRARDAINRRLYKGLIIVKTAIYRVFVIYKFHLADEGAAVVVNYASSKEEADRVVAEIASTGGKALAIQANKVANRLKHKPPLGASDSRKTLHLPLSSLRLMMRRGLLAKRCTSQVVFVDSLKVSR